MKRTELSAEEFNYDLPEERIAKYPLENRNRSKLLTYKSGEIAEDQFSNLNAHLPSNSILVFNDTKVIAARLYFKKDTGAKIEIFCLEPYQSTIEQTLMSKEVCQWQCMVGNLKRFKEKDILKLKIAGIVLEARLIEKRDQDVIVQFNWTEDIEFAKILAEAGEIPLPPYLNRSTEQNDQTTYQTVYAKQEGAVAAPTAGLHFVDQQLQNLQQNSHELAYLTLFVGAGTFRAVKTDKLVDHQMHEERIVIPKSTIEQLKSKHGKIICVGTTSLRSLESMYWLAVKMSQLNDDTVNFLEQEDAYNFNGNLSWEQACDVILNALTKNRQENLDFHSALFIMPSYQWKAISGLITNFHQPKSTLLSLVSSWIGEDWKKVYHYALEHDFRFLSYGDSSLLLK